ncbi:hypothetical protein DFH06DRAFT_1139042 [Mycena polygramma]|nr:hypothetical protein DFH06DRAFT_1139042 [Mycena polygramma]
MTMVSPGFILFFGSCELLVSFRGFGTRQMEGCYMLSFGYNFRSFSPPLSVVPFGDAKGHLLVLTEIRIETAIEKRDLGSHRSATAEERASLFNVYLLLFMRRDERVLCGGNTTLRHDVSDFIHQIVAYLEDQQVDLAAHCYYLPSIMLSLDTHLDFYPVALLREFLKHIVNVGKVKVVTIDRIIFSRICANSWHFPYDSRSGSIMENGPLILELDLHVEDTKDIFRDNPKNQAVLALWHSKYSSIIFPQWMKLLCTDKAFVTHNAFLPMQKGRFQNIVLWLIENNALTADCTLNNTWPTTDLPGALLPESFDWSTSRWLLADEQEIMACVLSNTWTSFNGLRIEETGVRVSRENAIQVLSGITTLFLVLVPPVNCISVFALHEEFIPRFMKWEESGLFQFRQMSTFYFYTHACVKMFFDTVDESYGMKLMQQLDTALEFRQTWQGTDEGKPTLPGFSRYFSLPPLHQLRQELISETSNVDDTNPGLICQVFIELWTFLIDHFAVAHAFSDTTRSSQASIARLTIYTILSPDFDLSLPQDASVLARIHEYLHPIFSLFQRAGTPSLSSAFLQKHLEVGASWRSSERRMVCLDVMLSMYGYIFTTSNRSLRPLVSDSIVSLVTTKWYNQGMPAGTNPNFLFVIGLLLWGGRTIDDDITAANPLLQMRHKSLSQTVFLVLLQAAQHV